MRRDAAAGIIAWQGRRVFITGATGFVGRHVARRLVAAGAQVRALVRAGSRPDRRVPHGVECHPGALDDEAAIRAAAAGCSHAFHIAAHVRYDDDWETATRVNVDGTRAVVESTRAAGVRCFVHTSSIVTIGASRTAAPLDEDASWNLADRRIPYITTKRRAEEFVLAAGAPGFDVVVVNPASVIGPDDPGPSEFGLLCRRFWKGRIPFHFGGGINLVDVRDVASGHLLAAERGVSGRRYIVGGENVTLPEFFGALSVAASRRGRWLHLPNAVARPVAWVERWLAPARHRRPYLSPERARVAGLFWHYETDRTLDELGLRSRPLADTLEDLYRDWFATEPR